LVTGDHAGRALDAAGDDATRIGRGAVGVQVAAAHARGLDREDHVARAGCRIWELPELELAISEKHDAFHGRPPVRGDRRGRLTRRSSVLSEASSPDFAISAFKRVHSPSKTGVNALINALWRNPGRQV